ncbi:L,D-transpeptidase [Bdellovibrionota bacterium FG-2]
MLKKNKLLTFMLGATLLGSIPNAQANVSNATLFSVDLRDLAQFDSQLRPYAEAVLKEMETKPAEFFPAGVTFSRSGAGISREKIGKTARHKSLINTVYGVEINELPTNNIDGTSTLPLVALFQSKDTGYVFRKMKITLTQVDYYAPMTLAAAEILEDIPASNTRFSLEIGLVERKAVLTDDITGIRKVYPLGVGSFDEGVTTGGGPTTLLTPRYANASLQRSTTIRARSDKEYFHGMPFIRVIDSKSKQTPIGLHIVQHSSDAPGGRNFNYMLRGFDSHGCMRLREKDLYEVYAILMNESESLIPISISYHISDLEEHPLPLLDNSYRRVKNFWTAAKPAAQRDDVDKLLITEVVKAKPPVQKLPAAPRPTPQPEVAPETRP